MPDAVVFLDMDGVISTPRARMAQAHRKRNEDRWIDEVGVRHLNRICQAGEAQIVVSSTWRLGRTRLQFAALLRRHHFLGSLHEDWRTVELKGRPRGEEVREWVARHPEVTRYIILDDDADFDPDQPLILTDSVDGLLYRHVEAAMKALGGPMEAVNG